MGIVFRQSIKSIIVTFAGALLGAVVTYISPKILSKQELGILRNILTQGALSHLLILMGVSHLLATYIPKYDENDKRRKVLITISFIVPALFTIIYTIPYVLFKQQLIHLYQADDVAIVSSFYKWVPVLVLLMGYLTLLDHYLMSQQRVAVTSFTREVLLRIINLVSIVLFVTKLISFQVLIISNVLAYIAPIIILFFVARRTKGFGLSFEWSAFSKTEYKLMLHFAWYHLMTAVSLNIMGFLDPLMLGAMAKDGLSSLPVYNIALFVITIMIIPYKTMTSAAYSVLNNAYLENNKEKLSDIFHRIGINILITTVGISVIIACNTDNAVALFPKGYEAIKPVVLILMIGRMVDMATGMNSELISFSKYYKFNFRISILLVIGLYFFNRILIPQYGIYGAAWSATLALTIFNVAKMVFLYCKMKLHPFSSKSLLVIFAGLVSAVAGYYMPYIINPIADAIIRSILILFVYLLMLTLLKPSGDLQHYINTLKSDRKLY